MEWLDCENMRMVLNDFMPSVGDLFVQMFYELMAGEEISLLYALPELLREITMKNLRDLSGSCLMLLLIGILSAMLSHLSAAFKEKGIGEAAIFFCYLSGCGLLLQLFYTMAETAVSLVGTLVGFTEVMIPIFYFAVAMTRRVGTAAGFYQLNLLLLYAVEVIIPEVVIPLVSAFTYLSILSGLSGDDIFSGFLKLLKKVLSMLQKSALLVVSGAGVMKKILHGATDGMNLTVWQKTFGAMPAVGDLSEAVTSILLGSSVLIKNGLGFTIFVLVIFLVITPLMKMFMIALLLQLISAMIGIFGDKRFSVCVERISVAGFMLLKSCVCCISVFLIVIALVCVSF